MQGGYVNQQNGQSVDGQPQPYLVSTQLFSLVVKILDVLGNWANNQSDCCI